MAYKIIILVSSRMSQWQVAWQYFPGLFCVSDKEDVWLNEVRQIQHYEER